MQIQRGQIVQITWGEAETTRLTTLWSEGLSASQIAKKLAAENFVTRSRNAIIGRVFRIGLPQRKGPGGSGIEDKIRAKRRRSRTVAKTVEFKPQKAPPLPGELQAAAELQPIDPTLGVLGLTEFSCRYPIGDPQDAAFAFCGRTCSYERPYCTDHAKLCYVPPKPRQQQATARLANGLDMRTFKLVAA
jgi:GcrA cell cycle regulator